MANQDLSFTSRLRIVVVRLGTLFRQIRLVGADGAVAERAITRSKA